MHRSLVCDGAVLLFLGMTLHVNPVTRREGEAGTERKSYLECGAQVGNSVWSRGCIRPHTGVLQLTNAPGRLYH